MEIFPKSSAFFWKKAKKMIYYGDTSFKKKREAARLAVRKAAG